MSKREQRRASIRAAEVDGRPGVTLKAITPHVVDDYGSVFMPDTFNASLEQRGPVLCWAHEWEEPLGPYLSHTADEDGSPVISFAFSDFEAVPIARRAHAQVGDGTIVDCSVGFSQTERRSPTKEEEVRWPGVREVITAATLDEVSLVLRGAVPGAKVLSMRSGGQVSVDAVVELAKRQSAGEITEAEAQAALKLLAGTEGAPPPAPEGEPPPAEGLTDAEVDAMMDEALDTALARSAHR